MRGPPPRPEGQRQRRVFVLGRDGQQPDPAHIGGTFLVYNSWARILFDTGATHSFIATSFVRTLGVKVVELDRSMIVQTLLRQSTCISGICLKCLLRFGQYEFTADLY